MPFLIALLDDDTPVTVKVNKELPGMGRTDVSAPDTTPGSEAADTLEYLTKQKFGRNVAQWEQWWDENKDTFGKES